MMEFEKIQFVHTEIGLMLSKVSGSKDIQVIRRLQDDLSNKLASGSVKSLNDLYEAIIDVTK